MTGLDDGEAGLIAQAVNDLVAGFVAAWNAKDVAAFGALFEEEADFVDIVGNLATGRAAIERLHEFPFTTVLKGARVSCENLSLRGLAPDLVCGDMRWKNVGSGMSGRTLPDQFGNLFFIARLQGNAARFIAARNTNYTGDLGPPKRGSR